ncbi:MAG: uracil-DNA glycosylase family protein [Defluviicoccus sp.]|nr:uracil-DNA glycosylase family protein [Defluviicoccus sp.]MDE0383316.1 uracil-DNA glycosylase family protein [Defluviicoccus sp.]
MTTPRPVPEDLDTLLAEVRGCRVCAASLPLGPRPVLRAAASARLLLIGQAPGTKVHASGRPWTDASGDRLRQWLDLDSATFYDTRRIAIVPMGFCYPGVLPRGGDRPPRPECAPLWHPRIGAALPRVALTVLIGQYAQARYLGARRRRTLTETVAAWRDYLPGFFAIPHPSWRTLGWQRRNPWFDEELLPELRRLVHALVEAE